MANNSVFYTQAEAQFQIDRCLDIHQGLLKEHGFKVVNNSAGINEVVNINGTQPSVNELDVMYVKFLEKVNSGKYYV